eukprot:SAG11_NODE_3013_length_2764_cov_4.581614_3_plen_152_part_00
MHQTHINLAFVAASCVHGINVPSGETPQLTQIRTLEVAIGALCMAKNAADLIKASGLGTLMSLMLDGGSMRAGAKFQAAVCSWLDENGVSHNRTLGSIPLRDGTDAHRVARVFGIIQDMLDAVKALGTYVGLTPDEIPNLTCADLMRGIGA